MKVAIFTETYLPYINGVVTHIHSLRVGLEMLGHEVMVVTADPQVKEFTLKDGVLYCPSLEMKKLYGFGLASPISSKRTRYLDEFKPDVLHIHQEFGIGLFGYSYAKRRKIPYVYTMHTMYDDYLYYVVPNFVIPTAKKVAGKYFAMLSKGAAEITGPSKKVEKYLRSHGVYRRIHVVPNPVDLDAFNPDTLSKEKAMEIRRGLGYSDSDFLVSFVGRIGREKGFDTLINYWKEALSDHKDIKLIIIGDGPDRESLVQQVKDMGMDDQIRFLGKIMHDELPPTLYSCDMYVTASLSDTNSISMLEAMALGMPVAHIKDELNQGQVVEGVNGYIFNSAEEMAEKIMLYKNTEDKESIKASVRESVSSKGAIALGRNLESIYNLALKK